MDIKEFSSQYIDQLMEIENESFSNPFPKSYFLEIKENNPLSHLYIILENEKVLGYIDYWITFNSSTISKIAVRKDYRRKGVASKLLDFMIKDLILNEVETCTLEVRKSNNAAIQLYLSYDFVKITTKIGYYDDGEDAIYMVKGV